GEPGLLRDCPSRLRMFARTFPAVGGLFVHRAIRLLIFLLLCVFPLTALGAVEIEEVTLEEEPVARPKKKTTTTKKKTTKKKKKKKAKRPKPAPVVDTEDEDELDDDGITVEVE